MGGGIDEAGWIETFDDEGFKDENCFNELFDNSEDWKAEHVKIIETQSNLLVGDDGKGMTIAELLRMYKALNSSGEPRVRSGKFNYGSKPAQCLLSRKTSNKIITTIDGKVYNTGQPNWKKMIEENITLT